VRTGSVFSALTFIPRRKKKGPLWVKGRLDRGSEQDLLFLLAHPPTKTERVRQKDFNFNPRPTIPIGKMYGNSRKGEHPNPNIGSSEKKIQKHTEAR